MKIAVVGAGIFGSSAAWKLGREGHSVDLFDKSGDLLSCASFVNQYRLHRGYHYPRSAETAIASIEGNVTFAREYADCVMAGGDHFYAVAKEKSLVNAEQFIRFCEQVGLSYSIETCQVLRPEMLQLCIRAQETLFDPYVLRQLVEDRLRAAGVNFQPIAFPDERRDEYDLVVYALYAQSNIPFSNRPEFQRPYQFELCEKPIFSLPPQFEGLSVVVMDGPFMCMDPMGSTGNFVMGNVELAIHQREIGIYPTIPEGFESLLNRGVVKNPAITRQKAFIESASQFFTGLEQADYIGSMYTFRTVPPNREADDGRPTLVERVTDREIRIFSGKIGTCVDAAEEVCRIAAGAH